MIVDCFLFAGEAKMAELRLRTLAPYVDAFVAVACTHTHQGQPADRQQITHAWQQAVHACEAELRLPPHQLHWVAPIMSLRVDGQRLDRDDDERGPAKSRWFQHIERQHRDGMAGAVRDTDGVADDTIVLMSDVDEIPHPFAVAWLADGKFDNRSAWWCCAQRFHSTALDLLHPHQPWWGTCVSTVAEMRPQQIRDARATVGQRNPRVHVAEHAGWHFSWFGTDAERQHKLDTFSHAELRGVFDPIEARRSLHHPNGEQLAVITPRMFSALDWPEPLEDGTFAVPESWFVSGRHD